MIPAIIRKCVEANRRGENAITAWGTGEPTREFLYVKDAADGILTATERTTNPTRRMARFRLHYRDLVGRSGF